VGGLGKSIEKHCSGRDMTMTRDQQEGEEFCVEPEAVGR
jgi:hypothetical protein